MLLLILQWAFFVVDCSLSVNNTEQRNNKAPICQAHCSQFCQIMPPMPADLYSMPVTQKPEAGASKGGGFPLNATDKAFIKNRKLIKVHLFTGWWQSFVCNSDGIWHRTKWGSTTAGGASKQSCSEAFRVGSPAPRKIPLGLCRPARLGFAVITCVIVNIPVTANVSVTHNYFQSDICGFALVLFKRKSNTICLLIVKALRWSIHPYMLRQPLNFMFKCYKILKSNLSTRLLQ